MSLIKYFCTNHNQCTVIKHCDYRVVVVIFHSCSYCLRRLKIKTNEFLFRNKNFATKVTKFDWLHRTQQPIENIYIFTNFRNTVETRYYYKIKMADKATQDNMPTMEDPQTTINEVINSVKSEGLFDQFRKECLEEFENMV